MEILIFIVLIALVAFFAAAETAYFSLHASKIRLMKKENLWNADLVAKLKDDPERLLITVLIGNTLANLSTAAYATALAVDSLDSLGISIVSILTIVVVLVIGEIIPKSLAYADNIRIAQLAAVPLRIFSIIIWPAAYLLNLINKELNRIFGKKHAGHVTEEEVKIMSRMSAEKGNVSYEEHRLIEKIFAFDNITVGSIMTPLPRVSFVNGESPIDNIAYFISQTEHSRYPVYMGNEDNIIGYIHVNSVMKALNSNKRDDAVAKFVMPIRKIDENMPLDRAFRSMNKDRNHMYLVHEHGKADKTIGLITLEDILEELVGEIEDETDRKR